MVKLKATWAMTAECQFPIDARRELLRRLLEEEDAHWGLTRSKEEMESQLDYLMSHENQENG